MMRTYITLLLMAAFVTADAQEVMRKEKDGTYVVNTTTLAPDVKGYIGATPIEIYIKKNKIVKVLMLKCQETPKYVARIKNSFLPKFEGLKITKGSVPEVDGLTGATFTSNSVKENVFRGVNYYQQHKK